MDNLTHTLAGAVLAETGLRDRFVLATPTLILAANVPDVDVVTYLVAGEAAALAWRRGITHGVPALILWPFVVAALVLAWDRAVRLRRNRNATPARFGPLLALGALGALTHPALDWLNTYGMRWWLPFDGTWSYGDSLFIVDPWLWLIPGGAVFLARSGTRRAIAAWAVLLALTGTLVLGSGMVPPAIRAIWVAVVIVLIVARRIRPLGGRHGLRRQVARCAVAATALYVIVMIGLAAGAERGAHAEAMARGLEPVDVMAGPRPARVMERDVVVRTASAYHLGTWRWDRNPRLELPEKIPLLQGPAEIIEAARRTPEIGHFLTWSRYPYLHAVEEGDGWRVTAGDARYPGRGPGGVVVHVPDGSAIP